MIIYRVYRVYNENGGYTEFSEEPQGVDFEIIDKTPTAEEIAEIVTLKAKAYEQGIIERFSYLMLRALSSSMGKYGNYEYLQLQKIEYDEKYKVAKGLIVCPPILEAINKEMLRDFPEDTLEAILTSYGIAPTGSHLDKMLQLVVFRYEYAESRYTNFKAFSIDFRTKCRTLVELTQWDRLDQAFSLVDQLPEQITDEQINALYNDFNAI
jgi:hypothetical protein